MSSEYYSLEKTAEVLGMPPAEVNRLRERSQLRAFRDGSSWKFKKVDIDNHLAEMIKARSKQKASESDFDLLGSDEGDEVPTLLAESASSFDALMEDGLTLDDAMVATDTTEEKAAGDDLTLADDPNADVDLILSDDEVVLDGTGSSSKPNLAQDSGLSLLEADVELEAVEKGGSDLGLETEDEDTLLLFTPEIADGIAANAIPVEDDFQLTPGMDMHPDDSESSSQVIALEEDNMYGVPSGMSFPTAPLGSPESMTTMSQPTAFGAGEYVQPLTTSAAPTATEPTYGAGSIVMLLICTFCLVICGWMSLDLIVHIWSWDKPFVINSTIMDFVAGYLK